MDLIKLDVEGAELLVLKGAQRILTEMRSIIVMEVSRRTTARFGYSVDDLLAFLEQQGYQIRSVPNEENAIAEPVKTRNGSN